VGGAGLPRADPVRAREKIMRAAFSSMWMTTNAVGIVTAMMTVAATRKRTRSRLAPRKSSSGGTRSTRATVATPPSTRSVGRATRSTREGSDNRFQ
jgi:hypothetical protein